MKDLIAETWEQLRIGGFRPFRDLLIVRTDPQSGKIGSLYLPAKKAGFYGGLGHLKEITATVCAVGPKATCKVGDRVAFMRLFFAKWDTLDDGTIVGWVNESNVFGKVAPNE